MQLVIPAGLFLGRVLLLLMVLFCYRYLRQGSTRSSMEILSQLDAMLYSWKLTQPSVQNCSKQTPKCSGGLPVSRLTPELCFRSEGFQFEFC